MVKSCSAVLMSLRVGPSTAIALGHTRLGQVRTDRSLGNRNVRWVAACFLVAPYTALQSATASLFSPRHCLRALTRDVYLGSLAWHTDVQIIRHPPSSPPHS